MFKDDIDEIGLPEDKRDREIQVELENIKNRGLKFSTLSTISIVFIASSFFIVGLILILYKDSPNGCTAEVLLNVIWDKLGGVYLVIFGSVLGGSQK